MWYDGRYLEWWADPAILPALPGTFATYEAKDIIRALYATVSLCHWLAEDVAYRNNLIYSPKTTLTILHWLTAAHKPKPIAPLYKDL
ncbi:MAG: hypothetical protein KJ063_20535 [Anaerolineae bacterium]|nr:hypothetical protein [Anaerolineae bacterium]